MDVKVGFRDINEVTPANKGACIGTFIGRLVNCMKEKGKEDEQNMIQNSILDAFIKNPVATKAMWDLVQSKHQKTLRVSFVLGKGKHARELDQKFSDMAQKSSARRTLCLTSRCWLGMRTAAYLPTRILKTSSRYSSLPKVCYTSSIQTRIWTILGQS
jgi:hypothetical protein